MPSMTEKVAMISDWQSNIGLAYAVDHLATFRAIQELHHHFPNGPNLRKDQLKERLAASQRDDMEERLDAPNCQVTSLQACNL